MTAIYADTLTLDTTPLISLNLVSSTGSQVIASQINVLNSKLTDFFQVEGGDLVSIIN